MANASKEMINTLLQVIDVYSRKVLKEGINYETEHAFEVMLDGLITKLDSEASKEEAVEA